MMLDLPPGWNSGSTGFVVRELLRQAHAIDQYHEAALAMTRASLDFMLSGPRWAGHSECASVMLHPLGWRINRWLFHVLPRVDDDALTGLESIPRLQCDVDLLAPPWAARFVRHAVEAVLPNYHVNVYSIDTYVDLRVLWTTLDMNKRHTEALMDLLQRYAQLVQSTPKIGIQTISCE